MFEAICIVFVIVLRTIPFEPDEVLAPARTMRSGRICSTSYSDSPSIISGGGGSLARPYGRLRRYQMGLRDHVVYFEISRKV